MTHEAARLAVLNARKFDADDNRPTVEIVNGSAITPRPIAWLWRNWLAEGKLHILAGSPGTGKTTIAIGLAAAISTGSRWPDGTQAPSGDVLIWSGEDDPADSLLPRFLASGGGPARVHFVKGITEAGVKRQFDPGKDMGALIDRISSLPNLRLLILDPIVSAVAGDSHKNAEVRRGLQPLVDLAGSIGCAVLGITHFTKGTSGRDPTERVTGSLAFGALARVVMATGRGTEPDSQRRLVRAKSNIGPDGGGFEYGLALEPLAGFDFEAQRVCWGAALDGSARELLGDIEQENDDAPSGAHGAAEQFLIDVLADGPVPVKDLKSRAEAHCIAWRTIERAKKSLSVRAEKGGMKGGWQWRLSVETCRTPPENAVDRQQNCSAVYGGLRDEHWEDEL